jgi:hypothetical protein
MEHDASMIAVLLKAWAYSVPELITWIIGLLVAYSHRRRYPNVGVLVIVSCALGLLTTVFMPVLMWIAVRLVPFKIVPIGLNIIGACLMAMCTALLLCAAFADRREGRS